MSRSQLELELIGAAAELAGSIPDEAAYRRWLAARCSSLAGGGIPAVARHNDLTMRNVVVDDRGSVGVLDWAEAEAAGPSAHRLLLRGCRRGCRLRRLPLRLDALRSCFLSGGSHAQAVAPLQERLRASLRLSPSALELAFHACWLRHALTSKAGSGGERPFLEIVRWLARRAVEDVT